MPKYERVTDESIIKLLDKGFEIAGQVARNAYRALYALEEMISSGKLKFVQEKTKKGDESK